MLHVGVIDSDESLVRAMLALWESEFEVQVLDADHPDLSGNDVLIVDESSVRGHSLALLTRARIENPSMKLVVTLVYCDRTQSIETRLQELADECVLKPYDVGKLGQTLRYLVSNG